MGIEEFQADALKTTAREIELNEELKSVHDRRMIALGAIHGYQTCKQEIEKQFKAELEAQKPKE